MATPPSDEHCLELLQAADCEDAVVRHVQVVARLAVALARHAPSADVDLVRAGALLHDIGRSVSHGLDHVVHGVLILRAAGVDEAVVGIVRSHVGAGIPDDVAAEQGWPVEEPGAFVPRTLEERIVAHADNLTGGDRYRSLEDVVAKYEAKGLDAQAVAIRELHESLRRELGVDPSAVVAELEGAG